MSNIQKFIAWLKRTISPFFASNRRASTTKIWIGVNLLYDAIQAGFITLVFHKHGLNGGAYLVFILIFSVPFSIASFRLSVALIEHNARNMAIYGLLLIVSFYAPDVYVIRHTRHVPISLYILLGTYLLITSTLVVRRLINKPTKRNHH